MGAQALTSNLVMVAPKISMAPARGTDSTPVLQGVFSPKRPVSLASRQS
jgi:hypothetical protein